MKQTKVFLMVFAVMLSVGEVSCNNVSSNGDNNPNGGNPDACWVDLGLPSGLLWAYCNLGASKPEEYGNYYAWGETAPKEVYENSNYCYGSYYHLTKYCNNSEYGHNGFSDKLTTLESMDDAATVTLGNGSRIPTKEEWEELINQCKGTWASQNGVNGVLFTGPNGKTLFLPAAGRRDYELNSANNSCNYWSSSLNADYPDRAWRFRFTPYDQLVYDQSVDYTHRDYGLTVRAVRQK